MSDIPLRIRLLFSLEAGKKSFVGYESGAIFVSGDGQDWLDLYITNKHAKQILRDLIRAFPKDAETMLKDFRNND